MGEYAVMRRRICQGPRSDGYLFAAVAVAIASTIFSGPVAALADMRPWTAPESLQPYRHAQVEAVIDGHTVVLDDGTVVRLAGIEAPRPPSAPEAEDGWPLAREADDALTQIGLGRQVSLASGGRDGDRHGRILAHLVRDDGVWVQAAMLERGLARVNGVADLRTAMPEMLAIEAEARRSRRGIWSHPFYSIRQPQELERYLDTFQLVEGRIVDIATIRGRMYLNFGTDWREDFTVSISPQDVDPFLALGIQFESLIEERIRVRGWVYRRYGPMIDATYPEQVEILTDE